VQYWRSFEHLTSYAANRNGEHLPAWQAFTRAIGNSGDVGIWHETYLVRAGTYETIYHNMPPFGLGRVGELVPGAGRHQSARGRMSS
jgi:Monooxygenase af470-like